MVYVNFYGIRLLYLSDKIINYLQKYRQNVKSKADSFIFALRIGSGIILPMICPPDQ